MEFKNITFNDVSGEVDKKITSTPILSDNVYTNTGKKITSGLIFNIVGGSLPTGLIFDKDTGVISGTPFESKILENINIEVSAVIDSKTIKGKSDQFDLNIIWPNNFLPDEVFSYNENKITGFSLTNNQIKSKYPNCDTLILPSKHNDKEITYVENIGTESALPDTITTIVIPKNIIDCGGYTFFYSKHNPNVKKIEFYSCLTVSDHQGHFMYDSFPSLQTVDFFDVTDVSKISFSNHSLLFLAGNKLPSGIKGISHSYGDTNVTSRQIYEEFIRYNTELKDKWTWE